eukprot:Nk52_evm2s236 gene=Nk52_evmTU2s236
MVELRMIPSLEKLLMDLRNKNEEVRKRAAKHLRLYVTAMQHERAGDSIIKFNDDLNKSLMNLVHSSDVSEKLGGIMAIDELIDIEGESNATKISRFANYLRIVLPGGDPQVMTSAAKALGHLALAGGTLTADFVEFEVKRSLEWLQGERNESRRHASVLVLRELAANAPTLFYGHVPQFFESIFSAVRDPKLIIREGSVRALRAVLYLTSQRESRTRAQWYAKLYEEALKGMKSSKDDAIHGSLLAVGELVRNTGEFMVPRFSDTLDLILSFKDSRNVHIQRTVITLIPAFANFCTEIFIRKYLKPSMVYIVQILRSQREKSLAFLSCGQIALAVKENMVPYLDSIMQAIKDGLTPKGRGKLTYDTTIFSCISMLAEAVGPALQSHISELLDLMFLAGLNSSLTDALKDLAKYIPDLLKPIQDRLLDMLSNVLAKQPYKHPGAPKSTGSTRGLKVTSSPTTNSFGVHETFDSQTVTLALKILGNFNFEGYALTHFVQQHVVQYLEDENKAIRREAATTCSKLLLSSTELLVSSHSPNSKFSIAVVQEILKKLLVVATSDPSPEIRLSVLKSLDSKFDQHLAQAENLNCLFVALNDEDFDIRLTTIGILGRLSSINPAYVIPALRKTLIQLVSELKFVGISRNKEECAKLLQALITHAPNLIKPYVKYILDVLLPHLKEKDTNRDSIQGVAGNILAAIGELAIVGPDDMQKNVGDLLPLILTTLQDQSSVSKRMIALKTLGLIAKNCGYVIEPYVGYPSLLDVLLNLLKTEQAKAIRREVIKVMGILGAYDPYLYKINRVISSRASEEGTPDAFFGMDIPLENTYPRRKRNPNALTTAQNLAGAPVIVNMPSSSEDYYPTSALTALMKILRDPSLSSHHTSVIQGVMFIAKALGVKTVPFLPTIMPPFLYVMNTCEQSFREFMFKQLAVLVSVVKQHIRNYLSEIFELIRTYSNVKDPIQIIIISLMESISVALGAEFKPKLEDLLPIILQIFSFDDTPRRTSTVKVLHAFEVFGQNLDDYLHLIIPPVVKLFEDPLIPMDVRSCAVKTIGKLCCKLNFGDYSSRLIHPLARLMESCTELRGEVMDTLCALVYQLGYDYSIFIPMVSKVMARNRIQSHKYDKLVSRILSHQPMNEEVGFELDIRNAFAADKVSRGEEAYASGDSGHARKLHVNQQNLRRAWETSQRSTKEDWSEWIRRLSVELLRESPSPALRSCASLAQIYYPLARELFNAAFLSCWGELYEQYQDELVKSLESALVSSSIPPEILQTLLNLSEFMEHDDKILPIDIKTLGEYASKCHAYAKALHYKEMEFYNSPTPVTIEALISINNQLQQPEAAAGVLVYAQRMDNLEITVHESWYEKLQQWDKALEAYEKKRLEHPENYNLTLGTMRCLHALGNWDELHRLCQERWGHVDESIKRTIAPMGAAAAWGLGLFQPMDTFVHVMRKDSPDGAFFRAILAILRDKFDIGQRYIDSARELLDTELTALVGESYNRAYRVTVRIQMLAELEEIIEYKKIFHNSNADNRLGDPRVTKTYRVPGNSRQLKIRQMWMKRLRGCQRNVEVWRRILQVRTLVVPPEQDMDMWLKYASLCRKSGRYALSHKTLISLIGGDPMQKVKEEIASGKISSTDDLIKARVNCMPKSNPKVCYAYLKHMFMSGERLEAIECLREFTGMLPDLPYGFEETQQSRSKLLGRCYLKLGDWQRALSESLDDNIIGEITNSYEIATGSDEHWYKAWHAWALMNFEAVSHYEKNETENSRDKIRKHLKPAVEGFFRSIGLSKGNSLQDTLRVLTILFKYGHQPPLNATIVNGIKTVSIDTWLQVIPQIIARIHTPSPNVRNLVHQLLIDVGQKHPQALIYPLTVASKSPNVSRQRQAESILEHMRQHNELLVEQAVLVSNELIRVAILWHEMWHEGLEEASRLYFGDKNPEGMFAVLEPLHDMIKRGAQTLREISFNQAFGRDLSEALEWSRKYQKNQVARDLNQAWDLYYHVFKRISKQLPQLTLLELQYVSPKLLDARDLELAVPGTYRSGEPIVKIQLFISSLNVITSKQRPRKLTIKGSDGQDYVYLLKGHEDLRQDERVMQLFGLVNMLLTADPDTFKRHLSIQRYAVIPLSQNSGLIGWVPNCDTLHTLIRDYRESRKILLNIEHRLMLQMAPEYDHLTLIQKVEVFQYALENTTGQDLYKVLWLKSATSEVWLDRRANYARSLAVMSMVGYMLGLGDRHPSNLMLDRLTGKILHIDFGDCFEVAMYREKFPERIPFRLTRMLVNAMEVSGIEGNFRVTCECTMNVLREHKDSLMAVLEAFVYDPLINWRLIEGTARKKTLKPQASLPVLTENGGVGEAAQGVNEQGSRTADPVSAVDQSNGQLAAVNGTETSNIGIDPAENTYKPEALNERAVTVIKRVQAKLTGRDFNTADPLDVPEQVNRLINQATSHENLCQCYIGWCPFW